MKIIVAEKIAASAVDVLREPGWTILTHDQLEGKLEKELETADALIVRSAVQANAALLEHAKQLRVIGRAGVGVDNIEMEAATRKGIAVMNTPGANAVAVAEHTLALMLAMARHLCRANETMHAGKWDKKSLQGTELRAKTLGVIGLGKIGLEVARRARAFGMEVVAHDPYVSATVAQAEKIRMGTVEEVFAAADYLTLHVGLTPQTTGMINEKSIAQMKKGVRLANVLLTPHVAGSTNEAQDAVGVQIAQQVKEYLKHGVIQNAVNVPSVSHEEYQELEPYIALAERMGAFLSQATDGNVEGISLEYRGQLAEWKTDLVRNAAVMGILNRTLEEKANVVNAASIAASRGIAVLEAREVKGKGGAGNVLSVTLKTKSTERGVKGAVLRGKSPRLLSVDAIDIEAPLGKDLLYLRNKDVPGVIGQVGTILGKHQINIGDFSLGRDENSSGNVREAIAVVHVDSPVAEVVLAELRKLDAVQEARAI